MPAEWEPVQAPDSTGSNATADREYTGTKAGFGKPALQEAAPKMMAAEPGIIYGAETAPAKPTHEEWLMQDLFARLSRSKFRMRFHLSDEDKAYIREKGPDTIRDHDVQIITRRLAPAMPKNDGKQTPMRGEPHGHPVFLAQHATGTCCRGCLETCRVLPAGPAVSCYKCRRR